MSPRSSTILDDNPSVEGPDYVTLIIEWDQLADDMERDLRAQPASLSGRPQAERDWRAVKRVAGVVLASAFVWRVFRRLRAA